MIGTTAIVYALISDTEQAVNSLEHFVKSYG